MDTAAQTTESASVRPLPRVVVRVAMAVLVAIALCGCNTNYECTTALDSGADIPWDFWTEIGTAVAAGAMAGAIAGALAAGGLPIGLALGLGIGAGVAFNVGHAIGHTYGDQIMGAIFGNGGQDGWFPGPPGPTDVAPGGSQSPGWSGSRNSDSRVPGQSNPTPPEVSGSTPDSGSAGGTGSGGSNVPRGADTTANAPIDTSDGLSVGELFHSEGVDVGGGSAGGSNPSGPGGSGGSPGGSPGGSSSGGSGGGTQAPSEELTLGKLLDMQLSDEAREVVESINSLNR